MKDAIQTNINLGEYKSKVGYVFSNTMVENTIIDEDKSVRWNREEVERLNEEIYKKRREYRNSVNDGENQFSTDVISMLIKDYKFTERVANNIYNKAYRDGHSEGFARVLDEAIEIAELFQ